MNEAGAPFLWSLGLGALAALANVVGGLVVVARKHWNEMFLKYFVALGAGFMLAATFLRMLPESLKLSDRAPLLILAGYFLVHFFEHTAAPHFHFGEEVHNDEMVRPAAALSAQVPIIPCSVVGAEEIFPILGNMGTVARLFGLPYAPITPTFPWLGPLGLIPLPSKWIIEFGAPIPTDSQGPGAADDPMLVFDLTDQVRETIQQTLYTLLMQRRSVFF